MSQTVKMFMRTDMDTDVIVTKITFEMGTWKKREGGGDMEDR